MPQVERTLGPIRVPHSARGIIERRRSHQVDVTATGPIFTEVRSDGFGNVYYRVANELSVIHRLTPSGVDNAIQLGWNGQDVFISDLGDLYQVGNNNKRQAWITTFNHNGMKVETITLRPGTDDSWIFATRLARFSSGRFLVLGYRFAVDDGKASPLIAIFDEDGFYVSDVHLPAGSDGGVQRLRIGDMSTLDARVLGSAALDSDGDHVYLALPGIDKPLLTLEPSGDISNVLPIYASKEGTKLSSFRVKNGRAILVLRGDSTSGDGNSMQRAVYKFFDLKSRKLLSTLHNEYINSAIATYDGEQEFTFFNSLLNSKFLMHMSASDEK
jgi:hypothetical protein